MGRNLLLVTLVAIIFTLLIPITNHYNASERALPLTTWLKFNWNTNKIPLLKYMAGKSKKRINNLILEP